MGMIAQGTRRWDGAYELRFPYNKFLVESLKLHTPACYREYEPTTKTWIVDAVYASMGINLLRGDTTPPQSTPTRRTDPHTVLYVLPDAPRCVVEAAYKALSREIHPDRAPVDQRDQAHEEMVAINEAYAVLRDRASS